MASRNTAFESDNLIPMRKLSATDAARRFSDLLDAVERRGESFLVVRHGRTVARIGPAVSSDGRAVKQLLRSARPDADWEDELRALRDSLVLEDRRWSE